MMPAYQSTINVMRELANDIKLRRDMRPTQQAVDGGAPSASRLRQGDGAGVWLMSGPPMPG